MISEEELNQFRESGSRVRVIRDEDPANDVRGIVLAWDEMHVLIRKQNRNVVKLDRAYIYQSWELPR